MNPFEIVSIIIACLTLLAGIIAVYSKMQIEIAKINTTLTDFRRELNQLEITRLHTENINRDDHNRIIAKLDELILKKC
jgi:hypothetical protein